MAYSVFLGNLSYEAGEESLKGFFEENYLTASCRVIYKDGRSRGFGYADFDNEEDFNKALELNGKEYMGREIRINPADSKPSGGRRDGGRDGGGRGRGGRGRGGGGGPQNPPNSSLIVRNLSYDTSEDALGAAFEGCSNAKVMVDRDTGDSKGFGFVDFEDVESATEALDQMNGETIDGRAIRLDYSPSRPGRGGGRGGRGGR